MVRERRRVLGCGRLPRFNPVVHIPDEIADPASLVTREAYAVRKPTLLFPTPERFATDVKQSANVLDRIEPFHPKSSSMRLTPEPAKPAA